VQQLTGVQYTDPSPDAGVEVSSAYDSDTGIVCVAGWWCGRSLIALQSSQSVPGLCWLSAYTDITE